MEKQKNYKKRGENCPPEKIVQKDGLAYRHSHCCARCCCRY